MVNAMGEWRRKTKRPRAFRSGPLIFRQVMNRNSYFDLPCPAILSGDYTNFLVAHRVNSVTCAIGN